MNNLKDYALAALAGTASTALDSDFLAQRAWDIAEAMERLRPKEEVAPEAKPAPAVNTKQRDQLCEQKKPNPRKGKRTAKNSVLAILDHEGKTSSEIADQFEQYYKVPINSAALLARLKNHEKAGEVVVERSGIPHVFMLSKDVKQIPVNLNGASAAKPKMRKAHTQGDLYDKKLSFAKKLGYDNVAEAISNTGKFEFKQKFEKWIKN